MPRARNLAILLAGLAAGSVAHAQTPAPLPSTVPIAPTLPLPPIIDVPETPLAPLSPVIAPAPLDLDIDFDTNLSSRLRSLSPKVKAKLDDLDLDLNFDFNTDINTDVAAAVSAATSAIPRAVRSAVELAPAVASSMARASVATAIRESIAPAISTSRFEWQFTGISSTPQQGWASGDPADSLYRTAREALNRGEYRRASQLFDQIAQKYPNSVYSGDARYWKAFALYRIGGADDLREALKSLESGTGRYSSALQVDAPTLATRIRGALAARGDSKAATYIQREAGQTSATCDKEDIAVRVEALNSLGQMDPESATPMLRRLLQRKDECSAGLRRSALFLLAKRGDAEAFSLLTGAAKSDPDVRIRSDAIRWLARVPGDQSVNALIDIVNNEENPDLKMVAIESLATSDNAKARAVIRSLVGNTTLNERLRSFALQSIDAEHSDDGGAFLRNLYPQLGTPGLQLADIRAIARIGGPENDQWLLSLVKSSNASLDVRRVALSYAGRSNIGIGDLVKMYDTMADRPIREALISLYARRTEPEATDKLMDIARSGTDPELRRLAIWSMSRKNDPRTKKLLLEIIDK